MKLRDLLHGMDILSADADLDCEIREAWQVVDGEIVPTNASISSPSIPRLDPGANHVSFSGVGIEAVRVFPRWWQL